MKLHEREELISHLYTSLANNELAQHMMTVNTPTAAETERIPTCSDLIQESKRAKLAAGALHAECVQAAAYGPEDKQKTSVKPTMRSRRSY